MKTILLVEDDKDLNKGLTFDLRGEGYQVWSVFTLGEAMAMLDNEPVDLILLDGNLPDGDGFEFCKGVKAEQEIPVILLTARDLEQDEIRGFDCGADDYITKPFKIPILHRRIQAVFKKVGFKQEEVAYDDGRLRIDFGSFLAEKEGEALALTPTEFKILRLLTGNADKVMTKRILLEKIWDNAGNYVDEHAVAVNINRLRKKLEIEGHDYIKTMYGMGYQWRAI